MKKKIRLIEVGNAIRTVRYTHRACADNQYTGRFVMFSVITNIYIKKTEGRNLMELFTVTGKLKKSFVFDN